MSGTLFCWKIRRSVVFVSSQNAGTSSARYRLVLPLRSPELNLETIPEKNLPCRPPGNDIASVSSLPSSCSNGTAWLVAATSPRSKVNSRESVSRP